MKRICPRRLRQTRTSSSNIRLHMGLYPKWSLCLKRVGRPLFLTALLHFVMLRASGQLSTSLNGLSSSSPLGASSHISAARPFELLKGP